MADEIQIEDLQNAKLDTITIAQVTNVGTLSDTVTNRDGVIIDTLLGRLKLIGFLAPEVYAGGINFAANDNVKTISRNGIAYYPIPEQLPFTTSGTWAADDETKFYVLQTGSTVTVAADSVSVTDTASYYTGSDAETILQEVGLSRQSIADALGVSVDDDNMGGYTSPYLTDDQPAKVNIQELSDAIENALQPATSSSAINSNTSDSSNYSTTASLTSSSQAYRVIAQCRNTLNTDNGNVVANLEITLTGDTGSGVKISKASRHGLGTDPTTIPFNIASSSAFSTDSTPSDSQTLFLEDDSNRPLSYADFEMVIESDNGTLTAISAELEITSGTSINSSRGIIVTIEPIDYTAV